MMFKRFLPFRRSETEEIGPLAIVKKQSKEVPNETLDTRSSSLPESERCDFNVMESPESETESKFCLHVPGLSCTLCLRLLTSESLPQRLDCGHPFCADCYQRIPSLQWAAHQTRADGNPVSMNCLKCLQASKSCPNSLATADIAHDAAEYLRQLLICRDCDLSETKLYCIDCKCSFCEHCSYRIHAGRLMAGHTLISLNECIAQEIMLQPTVCAKNAHAVAALVCKTCDDTLMCYECAVSDEHANHEKVLINEKTVEIQEKFCNMSKVLEKKSSEFQLARCLLLKHAEILRQNVADARENIEHKYQTILSIVESSRRAALKELDDTYAVKEEKLANQMEQFEAFSEFLRQITGVCGNYTQTTVPVSYVLQDGAKTQSSLMHVEKLLPSRAALVDLPVRQSFDELASLLKSIANDLTKRRISFGSNPQKRSFQGDTSGQPQKVTKFDD